MKRAAFIALVTLAAPCLAQNPSPWAILQQSREDSNRAFDRNLMILQRQREMAQQAQAEEARAEAQRAYAEAERSRQTAAIEVTEVDKQVGALVAAGSCDQARDTALRAGRFDLVDRVGTSCKP